MERTLTKKPRIRHRSSCKLCAFCAVSRIERLLREDLRLKTNRPQPAHLRSLAVLALRELGFSWRSIGAAMQRQPCTLREGGRRHRAYAGDIPGRLALYILVSDLPRSFLDELRRDCFASARAYKEGHGRVRKRLH